MRQLTFGEDDAGKRFILCYQALIFGKAPLARNELRAHGQLLDALEAIGTQANPERGRDDVPLWHCPAGGPVLLDEDQYMILRRFLEAFVSDVHRGLSREMDATLRAVELLPELMPSS